jgi:hypothetical protein
MEKYRLPEETQYVQEQEKSRLVIRREREEFAEKRLKALKSEEKEVCVRRT